ncbi:flagellar hook-length control protein FliK [Zooshikella ganghwensis]|uniref:flagellar hook-length control protein FliK n=1 Tax=Zooshikella ganghwensis TaxID=202772 RepID=UPI0004843E6B|nr:flagellar hook-length control protein FliK [Zooshikella ganghwensis]
MSEQISIFKLGDSESKSKASQGPQKVQENKNTSESEQDKFKQVYHDKSSTAQGSSEEKTLHNQLEYQKKDTSQTGEHSPTLESDILGEAIDSSLLFIPLAMQAAAGRQVTAGANHQTTVLPSTPSSFNLSSVGQGFASPTLQQMPLMAEEKQLLMQLRDKMNGRPPALGQGSLSLEQGWDSTNLKPFAGLEQQHTKDDGLAKHSLNPLQQAMFNRVGISSTADFSQLVQGLSDGLMANHGEAKALSASSSAGATGLSILNQSPVSSLSSGTGTGQAVLSGTGSSQDMLLSTLVAPSLRAPEWGQAFREQVSWLTGQGVQMAHLQLDPPDLGPVEVKVNIQHDQANISFTSHHAPVRDAIEQQLARLREQLMQQGFTDVNVDVSGQNHQDRREAMKQHDGEVDGDWSRLSTAEENMELQGVTQPIIGGRIGGVDFYA